MVKPSPRSENGISCLPENKNAFHLRVMQPGDMRALRAMLAGIPEFKPAEIVVAVEVIDTFLKQGLTAGYRVRVAVDETDNVIGYICFGEAPLTEGTWDIYWIAVAKHWRSRGVGRALMDQAEKEIHEAGGMMVLIETSSKPEYRQARMFYGRMDYLPVSVIVDFYTPGDSRLTLQKLLRF